MEKIIGQVNNDEVNEMKILYEKEVALKNLLLIDIDQTNRDKISCDLEIVQNLMKKWWNSKSEKYNWKGSKNGKWVVSFIDGKISLVNYE